MFKLLKRFRAKDWVMTVLNLALTVIQVAFTMLIVQGVGELTFAVQNKAIDDVWATGLRMALYAILLTVVQIIIQILASATASSVASQMRDKLYEKVNLFALSDMAAFSTESLITRTTNDIQNVHLALLTGLRTIFVAPITMIWSIIALVSHATAELTLVSGIWLFVLVAVVVVLVLLMIPKFNAVQKLTDELNVASRENLTGVRVVRAFNAEEYQQGKFSAVNAKFTKAQIFAGKVIAFCTPFITFVMMGLTLSILWVSAFFINGLDAENATIAFSATNSFVMLANQVVMAFVLLVTLIILVPRASVCMKRIDEILRKKESIEDSADPREFTEQGTIEFRNVGFAYPGAANEAVSDISFTVKKGETIAFIGATGAGKTTIINMIPRMADATRGEVLVDGVNVKDVRQKDLRDRIGYVPQRAFLFKGHLKENIAFCNPEGLSLLDVKEACKIAEADGFISQKREGYNSEVAQGGANYSGGQKQRLCIARALAKKPEILIFDDSFSALDYRTDKQVRANIKEHMPDTTRVIIAQRVGTIMDADQIVVLDEGRIVGLGKHADLVRNCPVYQEIALSQLSKEELGL